MPARLEPSRLALYGTLMSAFGTLEELGVRSRLRLLGPCSVAGRLYDLGEWPTLVLGGGIAHGELFEVLDESVFDTLDPFEEYDPRDRVRSSYLRLRAELLQPAGEAWVYVANHPVSSEHEIACGSWTQWLGERAAAPGPPGRRRRTG